MSVNQFSQAIFDAGLGAPGIMPDDELHRFHVEGDRRGSHAGWYVYHEGRVCAGAFGSWKTGQSEKWCEKDKRLPDNEWRELKAKIAEDKRKRKQDREATQLKAAHDAQTMWNQSAEALFHPYLKRKRVLPFGIRQRNDLLIIPLYDTDHKIWSYQSIGLDGKKRFMKDGRITGNFYPIGEIEDRVYIAEGFATAATLNQKLNVPVAVAFNAGNLKPVALAIKKKHPSIKITIVADNDLKTEGNPGLTKGREAASSIGANLVYPNFDDIDGDGSDFNDYFNAGGSL